MFQEVALGKRIGLYTIGKELGTGNFSKVKLGVHVLAKGKKIQLIQFILNIEWFF